MLWLGSKSVVSKLVKEILKLQKNINMFSFLEIYVAFLEICDSICVHCGKYIN